MPFEPPSQTGVATSSFALIITHIFVVAANEEILFRAAIPDLLPIEGLQAQAVSAVLFGLFHWTAYGAVWCGILFAIFAGFIFGWIVERWETGLVAAIGVHSAWNLFVLGAVVLF
ncbi:MAG: type II CAAX prenyl endopeptidase Rce1 family protein [Candidatus Saliniplasma sp.]